MSALPAVDGPRQCPFAIKHEGGVVKQLRNTWSYLQYADALPFMTDLLRTDAPPGMRDIVSSPFNHHSRFALISNSDIIRKLLMPPRFGNVYQQSEVYSAVTKRLGDQSPLTCPDPNSHSKLRLHYKNSTFSAAKVNEMASSVLQLAEEFVAQTFHPNDSINAPSAMLRYALSQSIRHLLKADVEVDLDTLANVVERIEQTISNDIFWRPESFFPSNS